MKKSFIALTMAVAIGFIAAVGVCVRALSGARAVSVFDEGFKIVIDAGHGGIDGGVTGIKTGVKESDINLQIAYELYEVCTDMGFLVTMTRKTQSGLYDTTAKGFKKRDMQRRKAIIQKASPDFVISVHQNFFPVGSYRGAQVFYNAQDENSALLASGMQARLNDLYQTQGAKARQESKAEFFMLDCYPCPSVLIECGFLSNAQDEKLLQDKVWQRKIADAIATGLLGYLSNFVV